MMSKAVLISINPKWCELIASGKKTVEVRKTKPKLETPFKVYIYATEPRSKNDLGLCLDNGKVGLVYRWNYDYARKHKMPILSGKVIGEFVCDSIFSFHYDLSKGFYEPREFLWGSCLSLEQLKDYVGGSLGYSWNITDLVIYDEPRELREFYHACTQPSGTDCAICLDRGVQKCWRMTRPPQSWCYVEEGRQ